MIVAFLDFLEWYFKRQGETPDLGPLRVFQYISVRAGSAFVTAFIISLVAGPWVIHKLRELKAGQIIRRAKKADAISLHDMHAKKEGTPTMGGLLIMIAMFGAALLFCRLDSEEILLLSAMSIGFGALGFWDDYTKLLKKNHLGLSPRGKIIGQFLLGLILGSALYFDDWTITYAPTGDTGYPYLLVPFFKTLYPYVGILFIGWVVFIMVASANAVNLTDGLDGLAIGVTITCTLAFTILAYLTGRVDMAGYLYIPHIPNAGEVVVFGGCLLGASLGFLWFNSHPAQVFMGDTGSMMLGGALGSMALLIKQEILLVVIGGIFVIETASVIIQVTSYKLTGRRVFKMSPLHHHYEKCGLHENKIIIRFWMISMILALAGIATLKLR